MKKIMTSVMLLMLAVTAMFAAKPVELKEWKSSTYNCAYFDWWYFGYGDNSRFGYVIFDGEGKEVAFTVMSPEETDYCAHQDGVEFPEPKAEENRDVQSHYYMSTYWVLNSLNGVRWAGDSKANPPSCVYENKSGNTSLYALRPGTYYFRVMEFLYDESTGTMAMGSGYDQVKFEISGTAVQNLKAEVAADKKTATITWDAPSLPWGAHLYMSVQTGGDVVFDNYGQNVSPKSPLTVGVMEGRTYSVSAQYINSAKEPLGSPVEIHFTVGVNPYIPTDLKATITKDDYVEFSWSATAKADYYHINVYKGGMTYASYTTPDQKLVKQIPTGTYTWEVAAYEKAEELYYPLTDYVKGNEFTTESAPLPEGTITLNVWGMDAVLFEEDDTKNRYGWLVEFATGTKNSTGYPMPWIYIYVDRELALSGTYSPALGNLAISSTPGEDTQMNMDGNPSNTIQATDAELKLEFEGFDQDYMMEGYNIPYYGGYLKMTLANGANYYAQFSGLICPAYSSADWMSGNITTVYSMLGEDGSDPYIQGLEDVQETTVGSQKVLENGQVVIIREGMKYNVLGGRIY